MFTIDLLKGQGIPIRSRPESIVVAVVTLAVPLLVAMMMVGLYQKSGEAISIKRQQIADYEAKMRDLSEVIKQHDSFQKEKAAIADCLSEVAGNIGRHTQWSAVLVALVENMPDSIVLTKLELKQDSTRVKVPSKEDPKKMVEVSVPVRVLQIYVNGDPQSGKMTDCDKAVRDFRDHLRASGAIGSKLDDIVVSKGFEKVEGQDVISYKIDCVFKPGV